MILHVGGASTATVLVTVVAIFFLVFAVSFAIGDVPEGERRFSAQWVRAWFRASLPRFIVAAAFSALLFAGSSLSGGGTSNAQTCDSPLAPLTGQPVSDLRLSAAIFGMRDIAEAASEGDAATAQALFFTTDAHNVTHDIAGLLFSADRDLARELCESVVALENEIAGEVRPGAIAEHAGAIALTLEETRRTLDFGATASATPIGLGPCDLPVGAVSDLPLTEQRLATAVTSFREAAQLAAEGDMDGANEAFAGDAHNITHDIDGPLRSADRALAVALCESVAEIERELAGGGDAAVLAAEAETAAGLLEEAGRALGISE